MASVEISCIWEHSVNSCFAKVDLPLPGRPISKINLVISQWSGVSCQLSVVSCQGSVVSGQFSGVKNKKQPTTNN
ncbi:MAG: hypothetical protein ACKPB6_11940 [Dolichospermum sp.]